MLKGPEAPPQIPTRRATVASRIHRSNNIDGTVHERTVRWAEIYILPNRGKGIRFGKGFGSPICKRGRANDNTAVASFDRKVMAIQRLAVEGNDRSLRECERWPFSRDISI